MESVLFGLVDLPEGVDDGDATYTEAAHIIPESTNHGIDKSPAKVGDVLTFHHRLIYRPTSLRWCGRFYRCFRRRQSNSMTS